MTRPVRPSRQCGWRRQASASTGCRGSKPVGSSSAPSRSGQPVERPVGARPPGLGVHLAARGRGRGPQRGRALGRADARASAGRARRCGTSGRPPPRRCGPRTCPTGHGQSGRQTRALPGSAAARHAGDATGPRRRRRRPSVAAVQNGAMLLADLVDTSAAGRRHPLPPGQGRGARRAARARPSAGRARDVDVVPRRHAAPAAHRAGLALRSPSCREPADEPSLTVAEVDAALRADRPRWPAPGRGRPAPPRWRDAVRPGRPPPSRRWLRGAGHRRTSARAPSTRWCRRRSPRPPACPLAAVRRAAMLAGSTARRGGRGA